MSLSTHLRYSIAAVIMSVLCSVTMASTSDPSIDLLKTHGPSPGGHVIIISISEQRLYLYKNGAYIDDWPVSTAVNGIGSKQGSEKTPLGIHRIKKKIGTDAPIGTIFKARVNTGKIATLHQHDKPTGDDYVTSRILWLDGMEPGKNKGEGVDSFNRYIYIHGTHEEGRIGKPASKGCIRMYNADVIKLFGLVEEGVLVYIAE